MEATELHGGPSPSPEAGRSIFDVAWLGPILFAVALLIRLAGIGWGLPDSRHFWSYHPDEPVIWAYSQQIKPAEGKFTPGFYNYGTLYLTLLRVSTDVVNGYGGRPPVNSSPEDTAAAMARYHLAGRMLSALAGAGLVWVVFAIVRRRASWVGALIGALSVTVAPALVVHSRFQTVDVLATFLLTVGLFYSIKLTPDGGDTSHSSRDAVLSGLFYGLSAGTKYTGLLGLLMLAVMCIGTRKWRELAMGVATCVATFVVTTPGILLDRAKFWRDFGYEMAHTSQGHGLVFAGTAPGFLFHLVNLSIGFGTILLLLGVFGLGRAVGRRHLWAIALAAFGLGYYLLIGRAEVKFMRYTFPLMPVLAVGVGWIVGRAHEHPDRRFKSVGAGAILGLAGLGGGGLMLTALATGDMTGPDPRDVAADYFRQMPADTVVGLVSDPWFYTPSFYPQAGCPRWVPQPERDQLMEQSGSPRVTRYLGDGRKDWDVRLLTETKPQFVVASSFEVEGLTRHDPRFQSQNEDYEAFMRQLAQDYILDRTFPASDAVRPNPLSLVHDMMYVRPTIWVWKRTDDSAKRQSGSSTTSNTNGAPAGTR